MYISMHDGFGLWPWAKNRSKECAKRRGHAEKNQESAAPSNDSSCAVHRERWIFRRRASPISAER